MLSLAKYMTHPGRPRLDSEWAIWLKQCDEASSLNLERGNNF